MTHRSLGFASIALTLLVSLDLMRSASAAPEVDRPPVAESKPVGVELFSPQGTVKDVRQTSVRFTADMVALGDSRLADPFIVDCPVAGKGRWADTRTWEYDFDADLPAGVRCTFVLQKNLRSVGGRAVAGAQSFRFDTGGPAIVSSYPHEGWSGIDEEQVFLLKLDAPATVDSVEANAKCIVQGLGDPVPVRVLTGDARAAVLRERAKLGEDYYEFLWKNGAVTEARIRNHALDEAEAEVTVLRCGRRLPPATKVALRWGVGIRAASGLATTTAQSLEYRVRRSFTAAVECTRVNPRAGCLPTQPIVVSFSAPVSAAQASQVRLQTSTGVEIRPLAESGPLHGTVGRVTFAGPFPEEAPLKLRLPPDLVDDAGRAPENADRFPLTLRIDSYPPLAKFSGTFGILESREGGVLPVTLRNVEPSLASRQATMPAKLMHLDNDPAKIAEWLRRVETAAEPRGEMIAAPSRSRAERTAAKLGTDEAEDDADSDPHATRRVWREDTGSTSVFGAADHATSFSLQKPAAAKALEVVGIPLKEPGFYVVELQSRLLGKALLGRDRPRYVSTAALVTNLAVHLEWGRESSLVWVTQLDTGAVVADAEVTIIEYCGGKVLLKGVTGADGTLTVNKPMGVPDSGTQCHQHWQSPLLAVAQKSGDFSFTQSGWGQGIGPQQFSLPVGSEYESRIYHTVFDRPLFRAGETVSMKHFLRRHEGNGFAIPANAMARRKIEIRHEGSGQHYELEAAFNADGTAESDWKIPAEAKLGDYSVTIEDGSDTRESGRFNVGEFRLPSMRATVSGPAKPLVRPTSATLDVHVAYLAGGGASALPVKLRTVVEPRPVEFRGYDDYEFGGTPVAEGIVTNGNGPADYDVESDSAPQGTTKTRVMPLTLDANGSARVTLPDLPVVDAPAVLTAELEYADANGEVATTASRVRLYPADLGVGIRRESWAASKEQLRFRVVVLDLQGEPLANKPVSVSLYQAATYSYRKRLIGGFYTYESIRDTRKLPVKCAGTSNAQGLLFCEVAPGVSGEVIVRAEAKDAGGHVAGATASMWVVDQDSWWFGGTSGDRMDVLPEKKAYEPGETARFQVRMPFRAATALVTVERQGVLSSFVTQISGKDPVIEVPIKGSYAPNMYVSVLALRGRVPHAEARNAKIPVSAEITGLVDLNKPAYRLGLAVVQIGWKAHRLDVAVTSEKPSYRVRDKAPVKVHVTRADGSALPAGTEVAIAAVDEALLDLAPNPSWDLLRAMMGERGLEVYTSTAQAEVVGKRHYGRKAVAAGGGGGRERDRTRELFDSLLYWKARVTVDERGDASVVIPLNDSLSSFKIVAIANAAAGLFGSGATSITTTQDLILNSGVPPLVREGDRYAATFTLRNTTDRAITAEVTPTVRPTPPEALGAERVAVPPGQSRDVSFAVTAPVGATAVAWEVAARDVAGGAVDRLKVMQAVIASFPVRTYQATIAQLTGPESLPVERPAGAIAGRGGLEVSLKAHLGDGMDGVRDYLARYPYTCLEQRVSQAIGLQNRALWSALMQRLPAYADPDGLLRYFPTDRLSGDDTLTSYVLSIAAESGYDVPDGSRDAMLQALERFVAGKLVRQSALDTADLAVRKLAAIDTLSRYQRATPAMLDSLSIEPSRWPTSAVIDWLDILRRVPGVNGAEARKSTALQILRARLNFQGTTMGFSSERNDSLWWLMISADTNANRLLLGVLDLAEWRADIPRLVRGTLARQHDGHWNTTVANAWGTLAMQKFSVAFESVPVTGVSKVSYGTASGSVAWPAKPPANEVSLPWNDGQGVLSIEHKGTGHPWAMTRATAAIPLDKPLSTGFTIRRVVTPVEQARKDRYTRGDVLRVHLDLEAQSDMSWVVVDDPVPAGSTILGGGLGNQSELLTRGERGEGFAWPAFEERRFDGFRAYYRFVPKGKWSVEYTLRLNNPGTFLQPATRVEAMYAPEMLGELPNAKVEVAAKP